METEEMKHYYQTTPLAPSELLEATGRAISQEEEIFRFMEITGSNWTAWDLKNVFVSYEITSIRRALFNLEKQGKISRSVWVKGPKGVKVGKYIAFTGKLF